MSLLRLGDKDRIAKVECCGTKQQLRNPSRLGKRRLGWMQRRKTGDLVCAAERLSHLVLDEDHELGGAGKQLKHVLSFLQCRMI
jgi:hypothetical protein